MRNTPPARPMDVAALMPAVIAAPTSASVKPSITISSTHATSGVNALCFDKPTSVGQNASFVDADAPAYLDPIFEPERTTPPGNGVTTFGNSCMAATAASAALS